MWTVLSIVFVICVILAIVLRSALAGRPTPDENDPTRQHEVTDPHEPHPDIRRNDTRGDADGR